MVSFSHDGLVSIWLGLESPDSGPSLDILKDMCGVDYYDLDDQEVVGGDGWPELPVRELIQQLSYAASFVEEAVSAASNQGIRVARWAVMQLNYRYDPELVARPVLPDPVFLGAFRWQK
jgi:hypothetical protein